MQERRLCGDLGLERPELAARRLEPRRRRGDRAVELAAQPLQQLRARSLAVPRALGRDLLVDSRARLVRQPPPQRAGLGLGVVARRRRRALARRGCVGAGGRRRRGCRCERRARAVQLRRLPLRERRERRLVRGRRLGLARAQPRVCIGRQLLLLRALALRVLEPQRLQPLRVRGVERVALRVRLGAELALPAGALLVQPLPAGIGRSPGGARVSARASRTAAVDASSP